MNKEAIKKEIEILNAEYIIIKETATKYSDNVISYVSYNSECRQIKRLIKVLEIMLLE